MQDILRYTIQRHGILPALWIVLTSRGLFAVSICRFRNWLLHYCAPKYEPIGFLFKAIASIIVHISIFLTKSAINSNTKIGPGLFISNMGHVIIGAQRIGSKCVIQENVTIGGDLNLHRKANLGDNVWIGANSVITGGITIGNGSTIREGTVLTKSIPPHCVVQGNPARVVMKGFDNSLLLLNPYLSSNAVFEAA